MAKTLGKLKKALTISYNWHLVGKKKKAEYPLPFFPTGWTGESIILEALLWIGPWTANWNTSLTLF